MMEFSADSRAALRRAELLSTAGAGLLGAGVGLLLERWLAPVATPLFLVGVTAHAWGMYARHRLESRAGIVRVRWEEPLYWLCWLAIAGVVVYAFLRS